MKYLKDYILESYGIIGKDSPFYYGDVVEYIFRRVFRTDSIHYYIKEQDSYNIIITKNDCEKKNLYFPEWIKEIHFSIVENLKSYGVYHEDRSYLDDGKMVIYISLKYDGVDIHADTANKFRSTLIHEMRHAFDDWVIRTKKENGKIFVKYDNDLHSLDDKENELEDVFAKNKNLHDFYKCFIFTMFKNYMYTSSVPEIAAMHEEELYKYQRMNTSYDDIKYHGYVPLTLKFNEFFKNSNEFRTIDDFNKWCVNIQKLIKKSNERDIETLQYISKFFSEFCILTQFNLIRWNEKLAEEINLLLDSYDLYRKCFGKYINFKDPVVRLEKAILIIVNFYYSQTKIFLKKSCAYINSLEKKEP